MDPHTEQPLNDLGKRVFKDTPLDTPSVDFTTQLMAKLETVSQSSSIVYKPLISKWGWMCIILILSAVSIYLSLSGSKDTLLFNTIDYSSFTTHKLSEWFSGIEISQTVIYAIGFFGLIWCIQIPMMKHILNKKLDY